MIQTLTDEVKANMMQKEDAVARDSRFKECDFFGQGITATRSMIDYTWGIGDSTTGYSTLIQILWLNKELH